MLSKGHMALLKSNDLIGDNFQDANCDKNYLVPPFINGLGTYIAQCFVRKLEQLCVFVRFIAFGFRKREAAVGEILVL